MTLREIFEHCQNLINQHKQSYVGDFLIEECHGRYVNSGCYSRAYCIEYRKRKYIVKFSTRRINYPTQYHLNNNPELRKRWLKPLYRSNNVIIQPRAYTWREGSERAHTLANCVYERVMKHANQFIDEDYDDYDIHSENIGLYRRRVVVFDC